VLERSWVVSESSGERAEIRCVWQIVPKPICVVRIPIHDAVFGFRDSGPGATRNPLKNLPSRTLKTEFWK